MPLRKTYRRNLRDLRALVGAGAFDEDPVAGLEGLLSLRSGFQADLQAKRDARREAMERAQMLRLQYGGGGAEAFEPSVGQISSLVSAAQGGASQREVAAQLSAYGQLSTGDYEGALHTLFPKGGRRSALYSGGGGGGAGAGFLSDEERHGLWLFARDAAKTMGEGDVKAAAYREAIRQNSPAWLRAARPEIDELIEDMLDQLHGGDRGSSSPSSVLARRRGPIGGPYR
jgi:hypothetical protein